MGQTFIFPTKSIATLQHFKRWPTFLQAGATSCNEPRLNATSGFGLGACQTRHGKSQWGFQREKQSPAPQRFVQLYQMLSCSWVVQGARYVLQKTASQYYSRFLLGSAPSPTRLKSMGVLLINLLCSILLNVSLYLSPIFIPTISVC